MVNGPSADEALRWTRAHAEYAVGLHVNLAHFAPLTDCPRLTRNGRFRGLSGLVLRQLMDPEGLYQVARVEVAAQLDVFRETTGRLPSHVDSHLWAQALPAVFQAVLDVVSAHRIPAVRNIEEQIGRAHV